MVPCPRCRQFFAEVSGSHLPLGSACALCVHARLPDQPQDDFVQIRAELAAAYLLEVGDRSFTESTQLAFRVIDRIEPNPNPNPNPNPEPKDPP